MKFYPRHRDPLAIISHFGYHGENRGYAREYRNRGRKRLRAHIRLGTVEVYETRGQSHATHRFSKEVKSEVVRFREYDRLAAPFLWKILYFATDWLSPDRT